MLNYKCFRPIKNLWHRLFLDERSSIGLSFFRLAVAFTVGSHVIPSFFHLSDNYFSTAYKTYNLNFFTLEFVKYVHQSPEWLIVLFVCLFLVFWFCFFIGFLSQLSCILMTATCYYFYALNSFHVGTLSWDILLVTLFLMCLTPYHGDYFSVDCFLWGDNNAYKRKRPYFLQRLLQIQIGFVFFYTALYKIIGPGNWLKDNPIYYLMNYPPAGTTKWFLVRDFLMDKPEVCYWIGVSIVITEILMIFLLFWPRTRISAIYLGVVFLTVLILTLDVPATFFFLFPAQLLLFIDSGKMISWIEQKRFYNQSTKQSQLIYDGNCHFCIGSIKKIKVLDLFATLKYVDFQQEEKIEKIHPQLNRDIAMSQLHLIETNGCLYGGFYVFRRICFTMPMLYPLIPILHFPGMGLIGSCVYKFVAKNRYLFHFNSACKNNSCFR